MLRIAIYYESCLGRNDGNPLYIFRALKRMEERGLLTVDHLRPTGNFDIFGKYDAHIVVDWGEDGLTGLLPYEVIQVPGRPLIYWASDTHLGYEYRLNYAKQADLVFAAQKDAVERFKTDGVTAPTTWLPHAFEPEAYCNQQIKNSQGIIQPYEFLSKKYDVCFVGHVNSLNRVEALDTLFKEFPNFFYGQRRFEEASEKYAQSKICFNISMKDDLNMRCFEVMGSKSLLLTDRQSNIEEFFEDKKDLVLYDSLDDMVEKAKYYLSHDDEREAIALSGYNKVISNHTIDHRLKVILDQLNSLLINKE